MIGPASAKRYLELKEQALKVGTAVNNVARLENEHGLKVLQSEHIPLKQRSGATVGVLTVEHDITDVVTEREKRARTLQNLVKTLVSVVDRRDPYAANHSTRVARVARAVAREMGLTETDMDTAESAANLLNLGKIMIPPEVLAKAGDLTEEERKLLRNSVQVRPTSSRTSSSTGRWSRRCGRRRSAGTAAASRAASRARTSSSPRASSASPTR